jgi:N-acyl-D-aspartate/D-glutamate deacylase
MSSNEAIRRLTTLPATNLGLDRRGRIARGYFAELVLFDASRIADHATYAEPHAYASGIVDVFVNGEQVLRRASTPALGLGGCWSRGRPPDGVGPPA